MHISTRQWGCNFWEWEPKVKHQTCLGQWQSMIGVTLDEKWDRVPLWLGYTLSSFISSHLLDLKSDL